MSYVLTAFISMVLGGIVTSCFALKAIRAAEKKVHGAYTDGYKFGFKAGMRRGKVSPEQKSFPRPDADEVLCGGPRHTEQEEATE